jgi:hypothetical protein
MPKAKRHCRRTSSSAASHQSDSAPHSESVPQLSASAQRVSESISQHSEPIPQHNEPIINEVQNQQPVQPAQKSTKKWDVGLIGM